MIVKEIAGYPFHYIREDGTVFNTDRDVERIGRIVRTVRRKGTEIKVFRTPDGKPCCTLSNKGSAKTFLIGNLLAEAFLGFNSELYSICYRDGDSSNVKLDNMVVVPKGATIKVIPEHYDYLVNNGVIK